MPSIACQSRIRAVSDHNSLSLSVRHHLVAGNPSNIVYTFNKTRFPDDVDVHLASNLPITLFGSIDGEDVSAEELYASALAGHLVECFRMNATGLGLNAISKLYIDKDRGASKVILTSSRQIPADPETTPPYILVAIDLFFSWQTFDSSQAKPTRVTSPFAPRLSLPYKTLLNNIVGRFMTWQLVKRYPLIFGPWCQQLNAESAYFPGIAYSIFRIMSRSPNAAFRSRCRRLIKALHSQRLAVLVDTANSLSTYLSSIEDDDPSQLKSSHADISDEGALYFALERVYRGGLARPQFKGVANASADRADDEDLSQERNIPPVDDGIYCHEKLLWDDPFKESLIQSSSSNSTADHLCTLPDGEYDPPSGTKLGEDYKALLVGDVNETDSGLASLDLPTNYRECQPQRIVPLPVTEGVLACDVPLPWLDFDDNDDIFCTHPSQLCPLKYNFGMPSNMFHLGGHITRKEGTTYDDSQDVSQKLELRPRSRDTVSLASLRLPSISVPLSNQAIESMGKQKTVYSSLGYMDSLETTHFEDRTGMNTEEENIPAPLDIPYDIFDGGDDFDLGILSDTDYDISASTGTIFDDLVQDNGVSVDVVVKHGILKTPLSHHSLALDITCPSATDLDHQLRNFQSQCDNGDEELWRGELEVVGTAVQPACFGEDLLFVMDFDSTTP